MQNKIPREKEKESSDTRLKVRNAKHILSQGEEIFSQLLKRAKWSRAQESRVVGGPRVNRSVRTGPPWDRRVPDVPDNGV